MRFGNLAIGKNKKPIHQSFDRGLGNVNYAPIQYSTYTGLAYININILCKL